MARFSCIRAEVENRRARKAQGGNDKIRLLNIVVFAVLGPWRNTHKIQTLVITRWSQYFTLCTRDLGLSMSM